MNSLAGVDWMLSITYFNHNWGSMLFFFAGAEKTVEHGYVPGGIVRADKQEVLPSQCQRTDDGLNQVSVYLQHSVGEVILPTASSVGAILQGYA